MSYESLIGPALNAVLKLIERSQRKDPPTLACNINQSLVEQAIADHMVFAKGWASEVSIRDMQHPRNIDEVFIRLSLNPGALHSNLRDVERISPKDLLSQDASCVVLGLPGAGKTTLLKHLCRAVLTEDSTSDDDVFQFPIVVKLREVERGETISEYVLRTVGISISLNTFGLDRDLRPDEVRLLRDTREAATAKFVQESRALLLLDGIDEMHLDDIRACSTELARIVTRMSGPGVILTCRRGAYDVAIDGCRTFRMCSFTKEQVTEFARRWFQSSDQSRAFLRCLEEKPYKETAQTPLHATNLCLIYEAEDDLPAEHTLVYEKIINVRLRDWDRERGIVRKGRYRKFGSDEKRRFLAFLAFEMARQGAGVQFTMQHFRRAYQQAERTFGLAAGKEDEVLGELEAHTGLVYRLDFERYEFFHKTVQEYLCAEYLSRVPLIPEHAEFLRNMPDACALATILSQQPDTFVFCLWDRLLVQRRGIIASREKTATRIFWIRYFSRLIEEKARFRGELALGLGILGGISWTYSTRELHDPQSAEVTTQLVNTVTQALPLDGVADSIRAILREYRPKDVELDKIDELRTDWLELLPAYTFGTSDGVGQIDLPKSLWCPRSLYNYIRAMFRRPT